MSAVKKTAKLSLYLFSILVVLLVVGVAYLYMNIGSIAKDMTERVASDALGVAVTLGDMQISLEDKKIVVSDIRIANPKGYQKPDAMRIKEIVVAGESFSTELLTFSLVSVDGTHVNLEVSPQGTNLGDLKKNVDGNMASGGSSTQNSEAPKVIVKKFSLTKAQLNPSVTLLDTDLAAIVVPDVHLSGIGQKENGIVAQETVGQIAKAVLDQFNKSANSAGFLGGLSLDVLNDIGLSTVEVFKKNLKESFDKDVDQLNEGIKSLKGLFE